MLERHSAWRQVEAVGGETKSNEASARSVGGYVIRARKRVIRRRGKLTQEKNAGQEEAVLIRWRVMMKIGQAKNTRPTQRLTSLRRSEPAPRHWAHKNNRSPWPLQPSVFWPQCISLQRCSRFGHWPSDGGSGCPSSDPLCACSLRRLASSERGGRDGVVGWVANPLVPSLRREGTRGTRRSTKSAPGTRQVRVHGVHRRGPRGLPLGQHPVVRICINI